MFKRTYKAGKQGFSLGGHDYRPGSKIKDVITVNAVNIDALVDAGHLELDSVEEEPCPACEQEGVAKTKIPKFDNLDDMREHYIKEHRAYEPPVGEG